ncbi:sodium:calcium antiporter [Candidatus Parcubacteria bacterium]|nr:sodium:calcium antiporter [Candidatus Parcubacteria bacterium]
MIGIYTFVFIFSCIILLWSGGLLVKGLTRMARFLKWKEFVVAFFVMAFAGSMPNLFIGLNSAFHKIPELSFGDVVGGNVIDLTLAVALVVLITKVSIPAKSQLIQSSSIFTIIIALLPIVLILDGTLGRGDGILLISAFIFYLFWLFSKKERFSKVYEEEKDTIIGFKLFIKDLATVAFALILLLGAAEGIVRSVSFFAQNWNLSLPLIGILIVGVGNALPEIYFAVITAKKGKTGMILGNLMGSIMVPATLVLGIVAIICPIEITNFSPFAIARFFLIISALFFFFAVRSDRKITKKEAMFLLGIYIAFVFFELLIQ